MTIAVVFNLRSGMLYTIDEHNIYRVGGYFWLAHVINIAQIALFAAQIILIRRLLEKRDFIAIFSFVFLPLLALIFGVVQPHIEASYPAIAVALLLIYVNVQLEQDKRLARQELELSDSRISIMLSQIQPHFIYNTLTAIKTLCHKDGAAAAKLVDGFSGYLRGNMDSLTQKELVDFGREIEHTRVYLDIEKLRFEERLTVVYDLEASGFKLPILTVQPLAENAVHHGVTRRAEGGTVVIRSREEPGHWRVTVEDDGVGFEPEGKKDDGRSHIGVSNVRERLRTQCGGTLTVESEIGKGTVCTVLIPKEPGN